MEKSETKEYDVVVVGAGLGGLVLSRVLSRHQKVLLLEADAKMGGSFGTYQTPMGSSSLLLPYFPYNAQSEDALLFIEDVLETVLERDVVGASPVTFDKSGFQPFIGFGENQPEEEPELSYYLQNQVSKLKIPLWEWTHLLTERLGAETQLRSRVTKMEVEKGKVSHLVVNGSQKIAAKKIIYTASPQSLLKLLPSQEVDPKIRQKISKGKSWNSLSLQLIHRQGVSENEAIHVLGGQGENPQFCLGQFLPQTTVGGQKIQESRWISFVKADEGDEEIPGTALREMKRQILKAYPHAFDENHYEKVILTPESHGHVHLKAGTHLLENLMVSSAQFSEHRNVVGTLLKCKDIVESLPELAEAKNLPTSVNA